MSVPRLELFITASTESGRAARRHVELLVAEAFGQQAELAVFDVERSPLAAQQARVFVLPTLILRVGHGERRCFGDFGDRAATRAARVPSSSPA